MHLRKSLRDLGTTEKSKKSFLDQMKTFFDFGYLVMMISLAFCVGFAVLLVYYYDITGDAIYLFILKLYLFIYFKIMKYFESNNIVIPIRYRIVDCID